MISDKSADFKHKLLEQKNKAYHKKTIKQIVEEVAGEHKLKSMVNEELANIMIQDKQQRNELDANFLTRLANEFDAIAPTKKGKLLFLKRGTASFSFNLAIGEPELIAESPVKVLSFKVDIDSKDWVATRVAHTLDQNGLTTQVEVEIKGRLENN